MGVDAANDELGMNFFVLQKVEVVVVAVGGGGGVRALVLSSFAHTLRHSVHLHNSGNELRQREEEKKQRERGREI